MEAKKFRQKPVVIEAMQYTDSPVPAMNWLGSEMCSLSDDGLMIQTLEGALRASPGDWIIKGVKGEFYPCKPDVFDATYEPVKE